MHHYFDNPEKCRLQTLALTDAKSRITQRFNYFDAFSGGSRVCRFGTVGQDSQNGIDFRYPFQMPYSEGGPLAVLEPDFFRKLHLTVLEVEGLIFNLLLFLRFCRSEIKALWRFVKQGHTRSREVGGTGGSGNGR
jgi:hypothetical protein